MQVSILFTFPKIFRLCPEVACLCEPDGDKPYSR